MSLATPLSDTGAPRLSSTDLGLYGMTIFAWGFSWIAMKGQVGDVPPEVSVFWRFVLAALVMLGWSLAARDRLLAYPAATHLRFAGLGACIFSTNFTLFYYGAQFLPSGLLAVVFSLASVFNLLLAFLMFGQKPKAVMVGAGLTGFSGIALMFWPQIMGADLNLEAATGLALCVAGTLSFCTGNMISASNQRSGLAVRPATTWGMIYGAGFLGLFCLLRGDSFAVPLTPLYLGSLVYLAVIASVLAFASYLTLLGRIGSARAGYATVIFPVVALTVSTVVENYTWTLPALAGLVLVMAGNVMMLRAR
ncbi:DMT family transporter [Pannonibacter tanglangensis]|uniref:EamA family transporter n=1 Tax=Pannonibacter tanglangensis TaxID=2750084 RepID=A0ABW9ZI22_9HYPH|nr:DMT family transporter [Pannonibacter sp. XCT-34]NBN64519.1 EamA family transporter [Pannonibacter sp. XCT-34]